jgi:hypothetical protein
MSPHHPAHPPHPERSTDGPWLGPDDNYPDDNYPDDNYPRSALTDHNVAYHLVHDNHYPDPGRSSDGTWPETPATAHPSTKEDPTTNFRKTKNCIQLMEVDGEM